MKSWFWDELRRVLRFLGSLAFMILMVVVLLVIISIALGGHYFIAAALFISWLYILERAEGRW